jgi:pimeloyl-ACP methyl ester carboxylesterase
MTKKKKHQQGIPVPKLLKIGFKALELIAPYVAMRTAAHVFSKPIKFRVPKHEKRSIVTYSQQKHHISEIDRDIMVYQWENTGEKVLIIHGWSSRGTQIYRIAEKLHQAGFHVVAFDAPAHGKSTGKTTNMLQIIEVTQYLKHYFGDFYALVGHSLGGNIAHQYARAANKLEKIVTIAAVDKISTIFANFIKMVGLSDKTYTRMTHYFEQKYSVDINDYDTSIAAKEVNIPSLVIHDKQDFDVGYDCAVQIVKNNKNATLMTTEGLGHSKILNDSKVVEAVASFIINP